MNKKNLLNLIFIIITIGLVIYMGYLCVYVMTDGITKECIRQNSTYNNVTNIWENCTINLLADIK